MATVAYISCNTKDWLIDWMNDGVKCQSIKFHLYQDITSNRRIGRSFDLCSVCVLIAMYRMPCLPWNWTLVFKVPSKRPITFISECLVLGKRTCSHLPIFKSYSDLAKFQHLTFHIRSKHSTNWATVVVNNSNRFIINKQDMHL